MILGRVTTEDFIQRSNFVHKNKYIYANVEFKTVKDKVSVECSDHGHFLIRVQNHMMGVGCKACGIEKVAKISTTKAASKFLERAILVHGNRYCFDKSEYKGGTEYVTVTCYKHGDFQITPSNLHFGKGCKECGFDVNRDDSESFIQKAMKVHGNKYDYSEVDYSGSNNKVKIICGEHGVFNQGAAAHIQGSGCPSCSRTGFDSAKVGTLYILKNDDLTKIGITNRDVSARINQMSKAGKEFVVVKTFTSEDGGVARHLESKYLKILRQKYESPTEKFDGYTECFRNVDVDWLIASISECEVFEYE